MDGQASYEAAPTSPSRSHRRRSVFTSSSPSSPLDCAPIQRLGRSSTVVYYHNDTLGQIAPSTLDHGRVGAEPGIDTTKARPSDLGPDPDDFSQITLVDFSSTAVERHELNGEEFQELMKRPRPSWAKCRWINVNGLTWDVISCLQAKYKLHRLAVEDVWHSRGRAKVDFYPNQLYVQLQLQKLIKVSANVNHNETKKRYFWQKSRSTGAINLDSSAAEQGNGVDNALKIEPSMSWHGTAMIPGLQYTTLHNYRTQYSIDRNLFMEKNSLLSKKGHSVSIEQVSLFLTDDNTIIAIFRRSGDDVEPHLLKRLESEDTILRKSEDASMLLQALLDSTTDFFFAIDEAYQDIIAELELDVLRDPSIGHSKLLYIVQSELTLLRNNLAPLSAVIGALRDHRKDMTFESINNAALGHASEPNTIKESSVSVSGRARVYLRDVEDHVLMIIQNVDTMRGTTSNLIDLIFNSAGALQNETMATLTAVTIFFLPLTFLTGYFGQNFKDFAAIDNSDAFFWKIAIPVMAFTMFILGFPRLKRFYIRIVQTLWIRRTKNNYFRIPFSRRKR